ncbi:MAG: GatB/YqeY domain-containing protein [Myxococcales bacterium]|jgi:uncharacterized protein YqeY|nr:GatB/YqeY domain-containing protein [Myxococcales bacterium]
MLVDDIKKRMFAAMKAGKTVEKEILRVCLGEITTAEGRAEGPLSDDDVQGVLRKLVKSNREALSAAETPEARAELQEELDVLQSLLPRALGVDEIVAALEPVAAALRAAPGPGPAMGIAMKHLKSTGAEIESQDVSAAIARIRG